ncbi:MAG: hypothetical protein JNM66_23665 [Bryobacterales bacterium]|nr:hypothetical protein [Bryobacterales bacterium]
MAGAAAAVLGSAANPIPIVIRAESPSVVTVKIGQHFQIMSNLLGLFEFRFPADLPFADESPDADRKRQGGQILRATKIGTFAFECFLGGVQLKNENYAGQVTVDPEG